MTPPTSTRSAAQRLRRRLRRWRSGYSAFTMRSQWTLRIVSRALDIFTLLASMLAVGCFVARVGFDNDLSDLRHIGALLRLVQGVFALNVLYNMVVTYRDNRRSSMALKWVLDVAVLVTLLPWAYPHPANPWLPWLERLLYSRLFLYGVLLVYAVVEISRWVMKTLNRRTNPVLMLSVSFLVFIVAGSLLLMMPKATFYRLPFVDSLFISTSAVCITGLTTVDVATVFTPLGQLILALLIQIGALGVLTFTSFFALFYSQGNSIYTQLVVKDLIYTRSFSELLPTILYILGFTLCIEAAGGLLIWLSIRDVLPLPAGELVWVAVFHSISSFANAGFSTIPGGMANPLLLYGNQWIYLAMTLIIACGSIGFPILINAKDVAFSSIGRMLGLVKGPKVVHLWSMNTKLVLVTTTLLFLAGALLFWAFESSRAMAGLDGWTQAVQSVFNSVTPRSAGFSSISPARFAPPTLLVVMLLMWIGGAAQSTAGGIKVNTFAAMMLGMRAMVRGRDAVTAFGRTISPASMARVHTVVAVSLVSLMAYLLTLFILEPALDSRALLFEGVSAAFTVGSSMGITPLLSTPAKVVVCSAMFFGRVGLLSLLMGLAGARRHNAVRFPADSIIIN